MKLKDFAEMMSKFAEEYPDADVPNGDKVNIIITVEVGGKKYARVNINPLIEAIRNQESYMALQNTYGR